MSSPSFRASRGDFSESQKEKGERGERARESISNWILAFCELHVSSQDEKETDRDREDVFFYVAVT